MCMYLMICRPLTRLNTSHSLLMVFTISCAEICDERIKKSRNLKQPTEREAHDKLETGDAEELLY